MSERKRLLDRVYKSEYDVNNFNIFPGEQPCTIEKMCGEINKALDQLEHNEYDPNEWIDFPATLN